MSECSVLSGLSLRTSTTVVSSQAIPTTHMGRSIARPPVPHTVWEEVGCAEAPLDTIVSVLFAGKTKKGHNPKTPKKANQDAFFMKHDPHTSSLIIGCFDGHGQYGHDVSRFCKLFMEKYLCTHLSFHGDVKTAVIQTTAALESEMLAAPHIDTVFSGSTMTLLILRGTSVYVANVGDSRVVLGHCADPKLTRTITGTSGTTSEEDCHTPLPQSVPNSHQNSPCCGTPLSDNLCAPGTHPRLASDPHLTSDPRADPGPDQEANIEGTEGTEVDFSPSTFRPPVTVQLSVDHKPDLPAERESIERAGGRVKLVHSTARVYLATDDVPGLAMSRSLGDFVAHTAGVSSVPEFFEYDLSALCTGSTGERRGSGNGSGKVGGGGSGGDGRGSGNGNSSGSSSGKGEGEYTQVAVRSVLLIGTDGVYDMISNEAAVELAFKYWGDPAAATEAIVTYTGRKWLSRWGIADDTTLCIVNLEHMAYILTGN